MRLKDPKTGIIFMPLIVTQAIRDAIKDGRLIKL